MSIVLVFKHNVLNVVYCYAPQSGRILEQEMFLW